MKKMYIKPINQLLLINSPIICIQISDVILYRGLFNDISSSIIYSEDDLELTIDKGYKFLPTIDFSQLKERKNLTFLYKHILNNVKNESILLINDFEKVFSAMLDSINEKLDFEIMCDDMIDLNKLLSLYNVEFKIDPQEDYLINIIKYFDILSKIYDLNTFITFSFVRTLTNNEINTLKTELSLKNINIIDFDIGKDEKKITYFEIDDDWCLI